MEHGEILEFLPPSEEVCSVLVVEAVSLLAALRQRLPQAAVTVLSREQGALPAGVQWQYVDFRNMELSFPKESFAYIIAPLVFDAVLEPERLGGKFWHWLRPDGHLLTGFANIRHWQVLQELMQGHFRYAEAGLSEQAVHFFALPEIVRFFERLHYRELKFLPRLQPPSAELHKRLRQAGFSDVQEDLSTKIWYVQAGASTAAAGALKRKFTPQLRRDMVYLLRRIENDIAPQENTRVLLRMCACYGVSMEYLARLAENTMVRPKRVLQRISSLLEAGRV